MERFLIVNRAKTPDGTILCSKHRHDYIKHNDQNGETYFLDGGLEYIRSSKGLENISIYSDDPHEVVREFMLRGTCGTIGDEPYREVLLKDIDNDWLENIILYERLYRPNNRYLPIYLAEMDFRDRLTY